MLKQHFETAYSTGMRVLVLSLLDETFTNSDTGEIIGELNFWLLGATNPNDPYQLGPKILFAFGSPLLREFIEEIPGVYAVDLRPLPPSRKSFFSYEIIDLRFVKKSPITFNLDDLEIYDPIM